MAIDGMMEREGLVDHRLHRQGRGVDIGFFGMPDMSDLDDTVLQPGMTFSIEPGIAIPGAGGVRIGDTVAVTGDGRGRLTPAPYYWLC
jgi:Xaa-Pro dipeptidase